MRCWLVRDITVQDGTFHRQMREVWDTGETSSHSHVLTAGEWFLDGAASAEACRVHLFSLRRHST